MDLTKQFFKYVSQNIFGLLGTSCYILADTYFIAQAAGTDGVTLLNLCLPIYNFIFAIGSMIALGSATRYAIAKAQNDARGQRYFSNAILCAVLASIPWMLAGAFVPGALLRLMGGDAGIVTLGIPYARIFLLFTPFFMCNYIVSAFVRNDGDPSLAMVATLSGSLFNVVFDYIFMFPLGLGLAGAALATAVSPIISIAICSRHFFKKENTLQFVRQMPSVRLLGQSCQLGISGFVGELSSGVTTTVFNFLLLGLAGNVGVAAYGVVANFALVATAIFNGVAQGAQPLVSRCYGQNDHAGARKLLLLGSGTVLVLAAVLYAAVFGLTDPFVSWFNSENSVQMAQYAHTGMRMYFVGYFFAGFNIMAAGYLSAVNRPVFFGTGEDKKYKQFRERRIVFARGKNRRRYYDAFICKRLYRGRLRGDTSEAGGDEPGESAGIWHGPVLPECRQKNTGGDRMPGGGGLFSGGRYPDECGRDQQHACTV